MFLGWISLDPREIRRRCSFWDTMSRKGSERTLAYRGMWPQPPEAPGLEFAGAFVKNAHTECIHLAGLASLSLISGKLRAECADTAHQELLDGSCDQGPIGSEAGIG
jgi:hypothetical protein